MFFNTQGQGTDKYQEIGMEKLAETKLSSKVVDLLTFYIEDALCGVDMLMIQEITKHSEITNVPRAPEYVMGILNLRGQIVTIIDLGKKLGISSAKLSNQAHNIIINSKDEYIGLLVERISDTVQVDWGKVETPPANLGGVLGKFLKGVFKTENSLIGILDVEEVLKETY